MYVEEKILKKEICLDNLYVITEATEGHYLENSIMYIYLCLPIFLNNKEAKNP